MLNELGKVEDEMFHLENDRFDGLAFIRVVCCIVAATGYPFCNFLTTPARRCDTGFVLQKRYERE